MRIIDAKDYKRPEWVGGSDVAPILGLSPWTSPFAVWEKKTGRRGEEDQNEAMLWGVVLEDVVAKEFARRNKVKVVKTNKIFCHDDLPFACSVDRFILKGKATNALSPQGKLITNELLEVKTSRTSKGWGEEGTDDIPSYYLTQVYWYMAITGCARAHVAVLIGGSDYREYLVKYDEDIIADLCKRVSDWWGDHIVNDVPPPPRSVEDTMNLYPKALGDSVETASAEIEECLKGYVHYKAKSQEFAKSADELKMRVMDAMKSTEALVDPTGKPLCTWKNRITKRTNWKKVALELNSPKDLIDEHTQESKTRTFLCKVTNTQEV